MFKSILFFSMILSANLAFARLSFPQNMTASDRQEVLGILGIGTNFKVLSDPYPLGGYSGVEVGVSYDLLPTGGIARLGSGASAQDETGFAKITLGKGLFYNVDFFLSFVPQGQGESFSGFGGAIRWGAYEMQSLPVNFSLQAATGFLNFRDKINTTTHSLDILGGWNFQDVVLFAGLGILRSSGLFIGGADGITDTQETLIENVNRGHAFVGLSVHYEEFFVALQNDQSQESILALKLGARY